MLKSVLPIILGTISDGFGEKPIGGYAYSEQMHSFAVLCKGKCHWARAGGSENE